jgi:hypothetical protein
MDGNFTLDTDKVGCLLTGVWNKKYF